MTEAEWLTTTDPNLLLDHLDYASPTTRKLRLFLCACCRLNWDHLTDEQSRKAVGVAERYADGLATREETQAASHAVRLNAPIQGVGCLTTGMVDLAASFAANTIPKGREAIRVARLGATAAAPPSSEDPQVADPAGRAMQAALLRDIFGNPFWLTTCRAAWRTPAVMALAQGICSDRRFEDMPVLADALEEASCHDAAILSHARELGRHVRGCWVLDLLLGKE